MKTIALFSFCLAVFALQVLARESCCPEGAECKDFVCQPCNDPKRCPECFPRYKNDEQPCCRQLAQVQALTAACVATAAEAFAAAEVTAMAATRVVVEATAVAAVGSFVSLLQTVSVSIDTGSCCEINAEVQANATAYGKAVAQSAAQVSAFAETCAYAQGTASAAAEAAASLLTQAEILINSTCCGFNFEAYQLVTVAGNYVSKALACVDATVDIVATARLASTVVSESVSVAQANTAAIASAQIDNCCKNSETCSKANATAVSCTKTVNVAKDLHGFCVKVFQKVAAYAYEKNCIETPLKLVDKICSSECSDVSLSCCEDKQSCCRENENNCCLASKAIGKVYLGTAAVAEAAAKAAAFASAQAAIYAEAITATFAAAQSASSASLGVKVDVQQCCSIVVTVSTDASACANAVAVAFSKAKGAAEAYTRGFATAQSVSQSAGDAKAAAKAVVEAHYTECCEKSCCSNPIRYNNGILGCCDQMKKIAKSFSSAYDYKFAEACDKASAGAKSISYAVTGASAKDCTSISRRISTKTSYILQCCCCTTKNSAAVTRRNSYVYNNGNDETYAYEKTQGTTQKTTTQRTTARKGKNRY